MRTYRTLCTLLLALTSVVACDAGLPPDDADVLRDDVSTPARQYGAGPITPGALGEVGEMWGPCDLTGVAEPDWWGCNGTPGSVDAPPLGAACLRPVSDDALSICVPQTADPLVDDDCGTGVFDPGFGLGVRVNGSAYCVADCLTDDDCAEGQACSPASHFCAWIGE